MAKADKMFKTVGKMLGGLEGYTDDIGKQIASNMKASGTAGANKAKGILTEELEIAGRKLGSEVTDIGSFVRNSKYGNDALKEASSAFSNNDIYKNATEGIIKPEVMLDGSKKYASKIDANAYKKFTNINKPKSTADDAFARNTAKNAAAAEEANVRRTAEIESLNKNRSIDNIMSQRALNRKSVGSADEWAQIRAAKQAKPIYGHQDEINNMIKNQTLTKEKAAEIGISADDFASKDYKNFQSQANAFYDKKLGSINREAGFGDKWGYHGGTQKAIAAGSTAWLVSRMSDSKGQMSNAGLYGQSQGY